jgi:hypothetical protein
VHEVLRVRRRSGGRRPRRAVPSSPLFARTKLAHGQRRRPSGRLARLGKTAAWRVPGRGRFSRGRRRRGRDVSPASAGSASTSPPPPVAAPRVERTNLDSAACGTAGTTGRAGGDVRVSQDITTLASQGGGQSCPLRGREGLAACRVLNAQPVECSFWSRLSLGLKPCVLGVLVPSRVPAAHGRLDPRPHRCKAAADAVERSMQ